MHPLPPPSPEKQLEFLSKLQRIFAEGDFAATYKHALLIALSDLAVELGHDTGDVLTLTTRQIADRFIQLYWQQVLPYGNTRTDAGAGVLIQNNGTQAAVVAKVAEFRRSFPVSSPQAAKRSPEIAAAYAALLTAVAQTVSAQPLTYLQNFGGSTDQFLYDRPAPGKVNLKPGVAYCLRRFYPLVQQLARTHWVSHVRENPRNIELLGKADDLESFLFSTSRQALVAMAEGLRAIDGNSCFYCQRTLNTADVDHFIPFSQYPRDLAHNFVLAHPECNRSKSDSLAGRQHLERWLNRLVLKGDDLTEIGVKAGKIADRDVVRRVAAWGYSSASTSGGRAWLARSQYELIDDSYLSFFDRSMDVQS